MMLDGSVTPEYIDEPSYVENGHYINVPPDIIEQGMLVVPDFILRGFMTSSDARPSIDTRFP